SGPLSDLTTLRFSAGSAKLSWHRDDVDMYAFHVDVPQGVNAITADFDVIMNAPDDVMASGSIAIINWNRALLYQEGVDTHQYFVAASVVFPQGWQFGTALRTASRSGNRTNFATTSLAMLV